MTIIELYDSNPINNIIGALTFHPEKIVYIGGFSKKQFASRKYPVLKKYLVQKKLDFIELEYVQVRKDDLHDIICKLENIYDNNSDCRFNIEVTGGEDLTLVAIGVLCQRHPEIKLFQISSKLRNISSYSLSNYDENRKTAIEFCNTVEDNLLLHGASIISADGSDCMGQAGWDFDIDFIKQINTMWKICCHGIPGYPSESHGADISYPNLWNKVTSFIVALDGMTNLRDNRNIIQIPEQTYINTAEQYADINIIDSYMEHLMYKNLLMIYSEEGSVFIEFENDRIRNCLVKSGNILELKTFLICRDLLGDYNGDVKVSVMIDWDGDLPDKHELFEANTVNEVDIIASYGLTPYFISCKNGKFNSDELYKLNSVAERFGAGYSKKIIITTDMQYALNDREEVVLQRAEDMGITVIDNVHLMTDEEFTAKLSMAFELPKIKVKK